MKTLPDGWFWDADIAEYRRLVRGIPVGGTLVELGVWLGRSLCSVADIILERDIRVIAVDTFKGTPNEGDAHALAKQTNIKETFLDNVRSFGLCVRTLAMTTTEAAHHVSGADLVFLDADHSKRAVLEDIATWAPLTTVIAGHDYGTWDGVREAVDICYPKARKRGSVWSSKAKGSVLAFVPTKNRYQTLPLTLQAIAQQTVTPDALMIYDDGEHRDLRQDPLYKHIFLLLESIGIGWEVRFGNGSGQHFGHEIANRSGYEFVWRVDDDEVPEPNVLERLLSRMAPGVGAVAGAVIVPGGEVPGGTGKIFDMFHTPNIQWSRGSGVVEVDHLYSSFLYRAGIVSYCDELSPVAHCEETIFTLELGWAGYKLLVDRGVVTHHYRFPTGGIRTSDNPFFYQSDTRVMLRKMEEHGYRLVCLNCGLGDQLAFLRILPALMERYKHLIIGCCRPELFHGIPGVTTVPVGAASAKEAESVYHFMDKNGYADGKKGNLVSAFAEMFGVEDPQKVAVLA